MKTSLFIEDKIDRLPKGYIFTYVDFLTQVNKREAVIKHLNRMVKQGRLSKLSKGKYYKPQETKFGSLLPEQYQIVKDLIGKRNKLTGYITGYSYFNSMGLTTQVSNIIQIAMNETRPSIKRGMYKIMFVKQKNHISKENIPLLRLLDTLRFIKKIPDSNINSSCLIMKDILKDLNTDEISLVQKLSMKYSPSTRAILGALLESNGQNILESLKESLNPITQYDLGISEKVLPTIGSWKIV
jgi:hypothetical protein